MYVCEKGSSKRHPKVLGSIMPRRKWSEIVATGPLVSLQSSVVHTIKRKFAFIRAYSRADTIKLTEGICAFVVSACAGLASGGKDEIKFLSWPPLSHIPWEERQYL